MGSFYHFFVHDKTGPVGIFLRKSVHSLLGDGGDLILGLDEQTFAVAYVGLFMQITGILQLPHFWGPAYSPFDHARSFLAKYLPGVIPTSSAGKNIEDELLEELDEMDEAPKTKAIKKQDAKKKKKKKAS